MPKSVDRPVLPVLPLRDVVVFPHMVIPLFVGREKSIVALEQSMAADKRIVLLAQKSAETDDPGASDLYEVGTLAQVLQSLKDDPATKAAVSGFNDPSGDPEVNAELSKQRAQNVANALAVAGIDAGRVDLVKPVLAAAGSDPAEARRVEVTVQ